ncbi:MAG: metallophosphoesterase [Ruminiclostridium sp.]|nr:metallophosphoesterase [Ruminiclostridium sp.]
MILVTGDIHGDTKRFTDKRIRKLRKGDTLIVCGDLGLIWDGSDREKRTLRKLGRRKYNILFVEGAHENFDELEKYPTEPWNGGTSRLISGNLRQLLRGSVFVIEGRKVFAFGGGSGEVNGGKAPCSEETAARYELPSDPELAEADKALAKYGYSVDYVVTYEPPVTMAEFLDQKVSATDTVGIYLDRKRAEISFTHWFFGKHHLNKPIPPKFTALFDNVIDAEKLK